jgi:hypothetical protein
MVTDQEIADARAVEKAAGAAYTEAQRKLTNLLVTRACQQYGVGIGKVVVDQNNVKFSISRVKPIGETGVWLHGHKINKDGSPGKREQWIRPGWKVVE